MPAMPSAQRIQPLGSLRAGRGLLVARKCLPPELRKLQALQTRFQSSKPSKPPKPFYVTTPIFYVNSTPHIGHVHSMVLADVCRRWAELKGQEAILCTGTDEHGLKVQRSAEAADLPTQEFCDMNSQTFRDVAKRFIGDNHYFIRTTDLKHVNAVQEFWRKLNERELIYESMHKGWYSVKDECFYPDDMLTWSVDPVFGKPKLVTKVDNGPVEWVEEKNYHFRLTAFRDRLLKWYDNNPEWIKPRSQMMEVRRWVEERLEDLSISRPAKRLHWGIPVPDDPSQTIYVWVDALINYISNSNFPYWHRDKQSRKGWPADLHIIGKDIVRFHGVYWPALLMALGLPLPKQILSHGHWTLGGGKMSKSSGNGVDPAAAVERFGAEGVRWFLMRRGPFEGDSAWDNLDVAQEYRSSLADTYGNLMNRLLRSQKWNLRPAVRWGEDLKPPPELGQDTMLLDFEKAMDEHRPDRAIERVLAGLRWCNKYMDEKKPWTINPPLAVGSDQKRTFIQREVNPVIYQVGEAFRISSILLQPFLRTKAGEALHRLGVATEHRTAAHARYGCDFAYGRDQRPWALDQSWTALFNKKRVDLELPPRERNNKEKRSKTPGRKEQAKTGDIVPQTPFMEMVHKISKALPKR